MATATPGVAAADAFEGAPGTADGAVFVEGIDSILAAGGKVAAVAAHESAERRAVEQDKLDE